MSIIRGENVAITFFDSNTSTYLPFSCVRSATINLLSDFVGKSSLGSGNWKEKEKVALDWNVSIEGAMYMNKNGFVGPKQMIDYWLSMTDLLLTITLEDTDGNDIFLAGSVLLTNVTINGTVNNAGSMNITGEGTGELVESS